MPTEVSLVLLSGIVCSAFLVLSTATLAVSVRKRRADRRHQRAMKTVRRGLFERRGRTDPDWRGWVTSLSGPERGALATLVRHYLRLVEGPQRDAYLAIANALELPGEARRDAIRDDDDHLGRLRALATLTELDQPVPTHELWDICRGRQRTREAGARLVYECADDYERPRLAGTELLVWDGREPLTIYGLDTLTKLNDGAGTPLLDVARRNASSWSDAAVIQICRVLEHTRATGKDISFDWLVPLLDHQRPEVRAAAVRALKQQGWRTPLRERVDVGALVKDGSPRVRRATYDVLAYWGDDDARQFIARAAVSERDARCRLAAVRAFRALGMRPRSEHDRWPGAVWDWLQAVEGVDGAPGSTDGGDRL